MDHLVYSIAAHLTFFFFFQIVLIFKFGIYASLFFVICLYIVLALSFNVSFFLCIILFWRYKTCFFSIVIIYLVNVFADGIGRGETESRIIDIANARDAK